MIKVGDIRSEKPFCSERHHEGKVIFVHPQGRWYTVEFQFPRLGVMRTYRECFYNPVPKAFAEKERAFHRN